MARALRAIRGEIARIVRRYKGWLEERNRPHSHNFGSAASGRSMLRPYEESAKERTRFATEAQRHGVEVKRRREVLRCAQNDGKNN